MIKKGLILLIFVCSSTFAVQVHADKFPPITNKDGSIVTDVLTPVFSPATGQIPFPENLLFLGTTDLTVNAPVADPNNYGDPAVALNAGDGFSTTQPWTVNFVNNVRGQATLDPGSVIPGQSIRFFEVSVIPGTYVIVTGVVEELIPGVDYVAVVAAPNVIAIIPLIPLKQLTTYMAVITDDVTDSRGNNATPDQTYFLTKRQEPWVDAQGNSTYSLVDNATAQGLAQLQPITHSQEAAAASVGIDPASIVLSWTAQTQSITPVLGTIRSTAQPGPTTLGPTGMTTAAVGGAGIADIYMGIITLPYYLGVPSAENPIAPLVDFWKAAPNGYVPPYNQFGLDPTSTNVTFANPFPVKTSDQTVPLLLTVPNANSGMSKPEGGWPVAIFAHGITRNRVDMLAIADTMASVGYAVIAMDAPLHGVVPEVTPSQAPFYIGNTPFAGVANERTFNVDYINNATGAPPPDGIPDPSGTHMINLTSMLTSRDNLRQGETDLSILALSIPNMSFDGDQIPDFNASDISFVGLSMGAILGSVFTAVEPTITRSMLSAPMGGLAWGLEGSQSFGPRIRAGLAALGIMPGTTLYVQFFTIFQTVVDSGDPINWAMTASTFNDIMLHEVIGDTVVPNAVSTSPLSGTEPLIRTMGLTSYSSSQVNPEGLDIAGRFVPPASHASLIDPSTSPATTIEMQTEMASFVSSLGTFVQVNDPSTLQPVVQIQLSSGTTVTSESTENSAKGKSNLTPVQRVQELRGANHE